MMGNARNPEAIARPAEIELALSRIHQDGELPVSK
jgi:hypothetical protein